MPGKSTVFKGKSGISYCSATSHLADFPPQTEYAPLYNNGAPKNQIQAIAAPQQTGRCQNFPPIG